MMYLFAAQVKIRLQDLFAQQNIAKNGKNVDKNYLQENWNKQLLLNIQYQSFPYFLDSEERTPPVTFHPIIIVKVSDLKQCTRPCHEKEQNNRSYVYERYISAPAVYFMKGQVRNRNLFPDCFKLKRKMLNIDDAKVKWILRKNIQSSTQHVTKSTSRAGGLM